MLASHISKAAAAVALAAACGCNSYSIVQSNSFANDDGMVVRVDYGRSEREHTGTFKAPSNGREVEFPTKLVVCVTMPEWPKSLDYPGRGKGLPPPFDGDTFTAWQGMNFINRGTMYRTDDGEWTFLANGFTCEIFHRDENDAKKRSLSVFRGVLCNTPDGIPKKDSRWRKVRARKDGKYAE